MATAGMLVAFFIYKSALGGSRPRLKCSPSLAFGLGTASQNFSAEKFGSGVQFPLRK
jgi:hypothetical protein